MTKNWVNVHVRIKGSIILGAGDLCYNGGMYLPSLEEGMREDIGGVKYSKHRTLYRGYNTMSKSELVIAWRKKK